MAEDERIEFHKKEKKKTETCHWEIWICVKLLELLCGTFTVPSCGVEGSVL